MTNQKQSTHIVLAKAEKNFNSEIDESSECYQCGLRIPSCLFKKTIEKVKWSKARIKKQ